MNPSSIILLAKKRRIAYHFAAVAGIVVSSAMGSDVVEIAPQYGAMTNTAHAGVLFEVLALDPNWQGRLE